MAMYIHNTIMIMRCRNVPKPGHKKCMAKDRTIIGSCYLDHMSFGTTGNRIGIRAQGLGLGSMIRSVASLTGEGFKLYFEA